MDIKISITIFWVFLLGHLNAQSNPFGDVDFFEDLDAKPSKSTDFILDLEKSIFGLSPKSTEKAILKKLGQPTGVLYLNKNRKALVYGSKVAFEIEDDKLKVVHIEPFDNIIKSSISKLRKEHEVFENVNWKFSNGIGSFYKFEEVQKVLKGDFKFQSKHLGEWDTKNSVIQIGFMESTFGSNDDFDNEVSDEFPFGKPNSKSEFSVHSVKIQFKPLKAKKKEIGFNPVPKPEIKLDIDPDKHYLGLLIGSNKNQILKEFGKPSGTFQLQNGGEALLYGYKVAFLIKKQRLYGIHIDSYEGVIVDSLRFEMKSHPIFSNLSWQLINGIKAETSLEFIKKQFGKKFKAPVKWQGDFETNKSIGRIEFYKTSIDGVLGDADRNYELKTITILAKEMIKD